MTGEGRRGQRGILSAEITAARRVLRECLNLAGFTSPPRCLLLNMYNRLENAMPIYRYDCNSCGQQFETLVRSSETPSCPSCESSDLTRQLSLIASPAKSAGDAPAWDSGGSCGTCPCRFE